MNIISWITSLGEAATTCITGGGCGDWSPLLGGITQIFIAPIHFFIDIILAVGYIFQQLLAIIAYLLSPVIFLFKFLEGIIFSWQNPVTINLPYTSPDGVLGFFAAFPGFNYLMIIIVACFWWRVFRQTLNTLKH